VLQLFERHGYKGLVETSDWPSYVETISPIYEPEEIAALLQHANPDEAILIKFCLASGFRDREIRYVTWRDVDFRNSVVPPFFSLASVRSRSSPQKVCDERASVLRALDCCGWPLKKGPLS
jgi:isopentenyl diphosphate isomerase/L-lactate dehydrogenase-like FMN-dependent dehydrogenase